jgi:hypothetical protein
MAIIKSPLIKQNLKPSTISKRKEWHVFPPALAKYLNPKQPDIAGAIVLFGIWTWLKNNYDHLCIDGQRHCARSLSELAKDHPYLNKKGIEKIIKRLNTRGHSASDGTKGSCTLGYIIT